MSTPPPPLGTVFDTPPVPAFDRILASSMGVKAYELVASKQFGHMVALQNHELVAVTLKEATSEYNFINKDHYLINTARKLGISFGD